MSETIEEYHDKLVTGDDKKLRFDPSGVFYDSVKSQYLVDVGTHYRSYTRKAPVLAGVTRHFVTRGHDEKESKEEAKNRIADAEIDNAVDWSGSIAGHKRGIVRKNGLSLLVTSEPTLPEPAPGAFPTISGIIRDAFPENEARIIFSGWLAGAIRAVRYGIHQAAPLLVMAGTVNTGKSLLAWITAQLLGGRVGHPFTAWSGTLPWNDDLVGAELLLIDDSVGTTDIRKRKEFGARFKEAIYGGEVQVNRRNVSAISLRPVWRVMVCCNDTPESLAIIPPIDDDLDDKVILLRVNKITVPPGTSTPEGKLSFQKEIRAELPAFTAWLEGMTIPDALADSRAGVRAWRDAELEEALGNIAEESRLEDLLRIALDRGAFNLSPGESREVPACDIEATLCDADSPVRSQANSLLSKHYSISGKLLGKLARQGSEIIQKSKAKTAIQRWIVSRPLREPVD
ncbi:primase-helicase family protein [Haloferula chungangensis]|uniref:Primase-helicase family protein n=1 Tax=Haloferula chungangensis TaxID=1048331 RepID=A0ABW2L1Z7_9BACT